MEKCRKCYSTKRQNKAGQTGAGSHGYRRMFCGCKYTPVRKGHGYDGEIRKQDTAVCGWDEFAQDRSASGYPSTYGVILGQEHVRRLPETPQPKKVKTAEMDKLFT